VVVDAVFHNLVLLGEAGGITMNELLRRERENDHPIPRYSPAPLHDNLLQCNPPPRFS
jgi:hypothetical protein